jgi:hypothetical protein
MKRLTACIKVGMFVVSRKDRAFQAQSGELLLRTYARESEVISENLRQTELL